MLRTVGRLVGVVLAVMAAAAAAVTIGVVAFFLSDVGPHDSGPDPSGALPVGLGGLALVSLMVLVAYRLFSDRPRR